MPPRPAPSARRADLRRACARLLPLVAALGLAGSAEAGGMPRARGPVIPLTLDCVNIRRLSDNYLLDLRIKMQFDRTAARYARFENTGRGWQMTGVEEVVDRTPTRIVLADTPLATAYIERLSGDYYVIDKTGTALSVWGRCGPADPLQRRF